MQFTLNFMRISKSKPLKWLKWVFLSYNLGQEKIIFLLTFWDRRSKKEIKVNITKGIPNMPVSF
jgi:hypothetical protein